jgi:hypothetical protein
MIRVVYTKNSLDSNKFEVVCDQCGLNGPQDYDAGDAAHKARKKGFVTVKGALGEPLKWACPQCNKKNSLQS